MYVAFYILYSPFLNKYYIGHTGDTIAERVRRHNTNHKGFTGGIGDWKVVYMELLTQKKPHIKGKGKSKIGKAAD